MTEVFSSLPYGERLLRLGLWTLEERRNRCDLIEVFKMFYGYTEIDIKPRFNTDIRKKFFSNWVIDKWYSLDQDTVDAPSLNCSKNRLNKIRCTRMGFFSPLNLCYAGWPQDKAAQGKHCHTTNNIHVSFVGCLSSVSDTSVIDCLERLLS